jgi:hypothetical protein
MDVAGDVLTLTLGGKALKAKLPRGERGAPGRDGISIKGDKGETGLQGRDGQPGRDSTVPGEKGERGDMGRPGDTPQFTIGNVVIGDTASATISGSATAPVLNLVIPRGERGAAGREGVKGKDGSHEFINIVYAGNCPRFTNDMLTSYCIVDGVIDLPVMQESEIGMWTHIKTFTDVNVTGLVEDSLKLHKGEGRKFVVVNYGGKYQFTAF